MSLDDDPEFIVRKRNADEAKRAYGRLLGQHDEVARRLHATLRESHRSLALFEPFEARATSIEDRIRAVELHRFTPVPSGSPVEVWQEQYAVYKRRDEALIEVERALTAYTDWVKWLDARGNDEPRYADVTPILRETYALWKAYANAAAASNEYFRYLIEQCIPDGGS